VNEGTTTPGTTPGGRDRFRRNPRVAQQVLGGRAVVLHYEGKKMLGLNGSGTRIWALLDGRLTLDEIARRETDAGASRDSATADVTSFVAELWRRDLVERLAEQENGQVVPLGGRDHAE
jgi:hypothetical protein